MYIYIYKYIHTQYIYIYICIYIYCIEREIAAWNIYCTATPCPAASALVLASPTSLLAQELSCISFAKRFT